MSNLVSIVVPSYNSEAFISNTIASVINQSYQNWELMIIDDCSTDNSASIIKKFVERDSRIKYLKTDRPSGSPALPRNIGIEKSKGSYIAFLDSDDIWFKDKLEKEVPALEKYDVVYSYYEKMDWDGARNNRIVKTSPKTTYSSLLKSNTIPCLTSIVSRKAIGETRFKQIPQEDFCFWLDILKKGYVAYNIREVTALYRVSRNSRSGNKLAMFKGYWNVIRNHQHLNLMKAYGCMITYSVQGIIKYLK